MFLAMLFSFNVFAAEEIFSTDTTSSVLWGTFASEPVGLHLSATNQRQVTSVSFYLSKTGGGSATGIKVEFSSTTSACGGPNTLLGTSNIINNVNIVTGWNTFTFPSLIEIMPGGWYNINLRAINAGVGTEPNPYQIYYGPNVLNNYSFNYPGCYTNDDLAFKWEYSLPSLVFPLDGLTPYDAPISSILDHSVDPTQGNHGFYAQDGIIRSYNDEDAVYEDSRSCYNQSCTIKGYRQDSSGTPFLLPLLGGYNDNDTSDSPDDPKNVLWYDGHPGYDYPATQGANIKAAHLGILCVASNRTAPSGSKLWRSPTQCPYARDVFADGIVANDSWDRWHAFYILLPNSNYSTWYLHSKNLETNIKNTILNQGWAEVLIPGAVVAYVGKTAPQGVTLGSHLHFEVRTNGDTPVDPYGDGVTGNPLLLWEDVP
jgi:hypothetical protein